MLFFILVVMRFIRPVMVLGIFAFGVALGWGMSTYNRDAATSLLLMRADTLSQAELYVTGLQRHADSDAQRQRMLAQSQEAIQALRQLYVEEEALWSYYAAIQESVSVRESLQSAQRVASSQLAEQADELARLDALVERLRPLPALEPFQFTSPRGSFKPRSPQ